MIRHKVQPRLQHNKFINSRKFAVGHINALCHFFSSVDGSVIQNICHRFLTQKKHSLPETVCELLGTVSRIFLFGIIRGFQGLQEIQYFPSMISVTLLPKLAIYDGRGTQ